MPQTQVTGGGATDQEIHHQGENVGALGKGGKMSLVGGKREKGGADTGKKRKGG